MFPKISAKQLEKLARQMGMQMENIAANRVVIECSDKEIIINNPQVSKIKMQGQETFQITGDVEEHARIKEEDIEIVAQKAGVTKEEARKLLEETKGDIILAIKKTQK